MTKQVYILQLETNIKEEPVCSPDYSADCTSDANDSVLDGSDAELTPDTATQQYREKLDAANLRTWSPYGLFPNLSSFVQPLLHGAPMSAKKHKALSCKLRDEIIQFLNDHKLIQHNNSSAMRWAYCALGRSLATRYPCMAWEHATPGTKSYSRKKNRWSVFIQRLAATRKAQKWKVMRMLQDANSTMTKPTTQTTRMTSTT
ncbi:uncharacterized protein LOC144099049 [Amblyomma americanum]